MDIVAIVVTALDDKFVGGIDLGLLGKLRLEELQWSLHGSVKEPADETQGKHVAALQLGLQVHASVLECLLNHRCNGSFNDLSLEIQLLVGVIGCVKGFVESSLSESVNVNDGSTTLAQELCVLLERSRVHCYQYITLVTRGVHTVTDVNLKTRNATQRALRCTHLGRVIGECGNAVTKARTHVRENVASQLHTITAVT